MVDKIPKIDGFPSKKRTVLLSLPKLLTVGDWYKGIEWNSYLLELVYYHIPWIIPVSYSRLNLPADHFQRFAGSERTVHNSPYSGGSAKGRVKPHVCLWWKCAKKQKSNHFLLCPTFAPLPFFLGRILTKASKIRRCGILPKWGE